MECWKRGGGGTAGQWAVGGRLPVPPAVWACTPGVGGGGRGGDVLLSLLQRGRLEPGPNGPEINSIISGEHFLTPKQRCAFVEKLPPVPCLRIHSWREHRGQIEAGHKYNKVTPVGARPCWLPVRPLMPVSFGTRATPRGGFPIHKPEG